MTLLAISHYRGGAIDEVTPLAKTLKAVYLKYGVAYQLGRFQTGPKCGRLVRYRTVRRFDGLWEGANNVCSRPRIPKGRHRDCKDRQED
jgi:hypothetical protein